MAGLDDFKSLDPSVPFNPADFTSIGLEAARPAPGQIPPVVDYGAAGIPQPKTPDGTPIPPEVIAAAKNGPFTATMQPGATTANIVPGDPSQAPPAAKPKPLPWPQVAANPEYQKMDSARQERVRNQYFVDVVMPHVPTDQIDAVKAQFDKDTKPGVLSKAWDIAKSIGSSIGSSIEESKVGSPFADPLKDSVMRAYDRLPKEKREEIAKGIDPNNATPSKRAFLEIHGDTINPLLAYEAGKQFMGPSRPGPTIQRALAAIATPEAVAGAREGARRVTDAPEIGSYGESLMRGFGIIAQSSAARSLSANATLNDVVAKIDRGETVLDADDAAGYQYMSPEQRAQYKETLAQTTTTAIAELSNHIKTLNDIPQPGVVKQFTGAKTFGEAWDAFKESPVDIIGHLGIESAPASMQMMVGALAGGVAGGAPGAAAAMGLSSAVSEYGGAIVDALSEAGVDVSDRAALKKAASNPELMAKVRSIAFRKSAVVGTLDAVAGGVAGKSLTTAAFAARRPVASEVANLAAQAPIQGTLGAAGEVLGSAAAGKESTVGEAAGEFAGEFATTPFDIASMALFRKKLGKVRTSNSSTGAPSQPQIPGEPQPVLSSTKLPNENFQTPESLSTGAPSKAKEAGKPQPAEDLNSPVDASTVLDTVEGEAQPFNPDGWTKAENTINKKSGKPRFREGKAQYSRSENGVDHVVTTDNGEVTHSISTHRGFVIENSYMGDEPLRVDVRVDNKTGTLTAMIGDTVQEQVPYDLSPRAKQNFKDGMPMAKILETEYSDSQGYLPDGKQAPHTTTVKKSDAPSANTVEGEKIDKEWTAFAPESGTLNIPRAEMPQVAADHRGALVNFLNARGITHEQEEIDPTELKPTQTEFSPAKVAKAVEDGRDRSILVSSDGYVLDGHHQWLAKLESGDPIKVIRLDSPIKDLLPAVHEFPSSFTRDGATERRTDSSFRKRVADMSAEEKDAALLKDSMTGLWNRRALEDDHTPGVVGASDLDGLKWANDNVAEAFGDDLIKAKGQVLAQVAKEMPGIFAVKLRDGGDEFALKGKDTATVEQAYKRAQEIAAKVVLTFQLPDGSTIEKTGVDFQYAIDQNYDAAIAGVKKRKAELDAANPNRRTEEPAGVRRIVAKGQQTGVDQDAGRDKDQVDGQAVDQPGVVADSSGSNTGGVRSGAGAAQSGNEPPAGTGGATPADSQATVTKTPEKSGVVHLGTYGVMPSKNNKALTLQENDGIFTLLQDGQPALDFDSGEPITYASVEEAVADLKAELKKKDGRRFLSNKQGIYFAAEFKGEKAAGEQPSTLTQQAEKIGADKALLEKRFKEAIGVLTDEFRKHFTGGKGTLDFEGKRYVSSDGQYELRWENDGKTNRGSVSAHKVATKAPEATEPPIPPAPSGPTAAELQAIKDKGKPVSAANAANVSEDDFNSLIAEVQAERKAPEEVAPLSIPEEREPAPTEQPKEEVKAGEPKEFAEGDRVQFVEGNDRSGRHGVIAKKEVTHWTTHRLFGGGRAETTERSVYYQVKTDNGGTLHTSPHEIVAETSRPEHVIADVMLDDNWQDPARVYSLIGHYKNSANNARAAAMRAKLDKKKKEHMASAARYDADSAKYRKAFDEWAKQYPDEAAKLEPKTDKPKATEQPTTSAGTADIPAMVIIEAKGKLGQKLWIVNMQKREEYSVFQKMEARAKEFGGYYARARGATKGFTFTTEAKAREFMGQGEAPTDDKAKGWEARFVADMRAIADELRAGGLNTEAAEVDGAAHPIPYHWTESHAREYIESRRKYADRHLRAAARAAEQGSGSFAAGVAALKNGEPRLLPASLTNKSGIDAAPARDWLRGWDGANAAAPVEPTSTPSPLSGRDAVLPDQPSKRLPTPQVAPLAGMTPLGAKDAGTIASEGAGHVTQGIKEGLAGLDALFGRKGTVGMGPAFDEQTWAKAKPHFQAAYKEFVEAGKSLKEFVRYILQEYNDSIVPYLQQWHKELGEAPNERTSTDEQGSKTLDGVAPGADGETEGIGGVSGSYADGGEAGASQNQQPDDHGIPGARSGRGRSGRVHTPKTRGQRKSSGLGEEGTGTEGSGLPEHDAVADVEGALAPNIPGQNFRITADTRLGQGAELEKFNDNIAAIKILKSLEDEVRRATPQEQKALARYVGWGGLANAFPDPVTGKYKPAWEKRGPELRELISGAEFRAASNSTKNAHYTSETIVSSIWDAVRRLGYKGGLALESSAGTGNFLGLIPDDLAGSTRFIAVEYDSLTARIAQALYPQETVLHAGFHKVPLPDNVFSLNIGNPPFGKDSLRFQYKPELRGVSIHNQFFRAAMDALRPGGIQAAVVSRYLMDSQDNDSRLALARQARLIGAIRLPDTAFKENARTEVVTDILFFQKLDHAEQRAASEAVDAYLRRPEKDHIAEDERKQVAARVPKWVTTVQIADPLGGDPMHVNHYFASNRHMILGTMERSGSMNFGADITVRLDDTAALSGMLADAIENLPENVMETGDEVLAATEQRFKNLSDSLRISLANEEPGHIGFNEGGKLQRVIERETPEGSYELTRQEITANSPWSEQLYLNAEGHWYRLAPVLNADGTPQKVMKGDVATKRNIYERSEYQNESDIPASLRLGEGEFARLKLMVTLRDLLKRQLILETEDAPTATMETNRGKLAGAYQSFVAAHGFVNTPKNMRLVNGMPDGALVLALENDYRGGVTKEQAAKTGQQVTPESATPAPIMKTRVIPKYQAATKADSAADALGITLSERGIVDVPRIAELVGKTEDEVTANLQAGDKPLIFLDPETNRWETANVYLSGQVKRKLNAAEVAGNSINIKALKAIQPEAWTAEQVTAVMGGTWIPPDVYADFFMHLTKGEATVRFAPVTNTFSLVVRQTGETAGDWGSQGAPVDYIVGRILNSQPVVVMEPGDRDHGPTIDHELTAMAVLKAKEISEEFRDWVFADGDRREKLVAIFNEKYNNRVNRQHDGSHLTLPGKVPDTILAMRRHQLNAIWRGITDRFMLLDHVVGAGKTFTAIARAMERRRMGLSKKPMIVVPNHLVQQFTADVYRLYPGAKVLAAGKHDFEAKRRRRIFAKIATGDWDIVIVPHSSFGFIGIAPETEQRFLEEEMRIAIQAVADAEEQAIEDGTADGRRKPFGVKAAERLVTKIQTRMDSLNARTRDRLLTFEQMGVDDLTVDEAHEFKNLFYSSRLTGVRGMGNAVGSSKSADLYNKIRVLQETPTASVVFMTGTPISNSAVEMYNMMRFLAPQLLRDAGLEHFDAWRSQYVEATSKHEPTESGRLKEVTRLGRTWANMRSLMEMYYSFSDAVSNEDIIKAYAADNDGKAFPIPKIKGGERQLVAIKPTAAQTILLRDTMASFDSLKNDYPDPYDRNAARLRLMDRARKLSLDVRAVEPMNPSQEEGGKLDVAAQTIAEIYHRTTAHRGTQLVFSDRGVPKSKEDKRILKEYDALVSKRDAALANRDESAYQSALDSLEKYDPNEMAELRIAQAGGWNAYEQLKDNLIALGIPAHEIRFMQEASTDAQKKAIFDAVNGGKIRILIGSTQRMGAGTNVQQRMVALHHIDVTWKPSDIEQREGRLIRQGNLFATPPTASVPNPLYRPDFEAEIKAYATETTVDAKMWDLNATKLKMINGIRKYDGAFSMEFDDADSVSMSEMAALASGNPLLLERVTLESQIATLELQERGYRRTMYSVDDQIRRAERSIEHGPSQVAQIEATAKDVSPRISELETKAKARRVSVEGNVRATYFEAMTDAKAAIAAQQAGNENARYTVTIDGNRYTSQDAIEQAIGDALGDKEPFELTMGGEVYTRRTMAARHVAQLLNQALTLWQDRAKDMTLREKATLYGYKLVIDLHKSSVDSKYIYANAALMNDLGKAVVSASIDIEVKKGSAEGFSTQGVRPLFEKIDESIKSEGRGATGWLKEMIKQAHDELPGLLLRRAKPFPKAEEIEQKRAQLRVVVQQLLGKGPAATINEPGLYLVTNDEGIVEDAPRMLSADDIEQLISHGWTIEKVGELKFSSKVDASKPFNQNAKHEYLPDSRGDAERLRVTAGHTLGRTLPPGSIRLARLPEHSSLQKIAAAFGKRVVGFESTTPLLNVNGATSAGDSVIYISVNATRPALSVLGHELGHQLKKESPAQYMKLVDFIRQSIDQGRYSTEFAGMRNAEGKLVYEGYNDEAIREEFVSEVISDGMVSPAFWYELAAHNQTLFDRIVKVLSALIEKIKQALKPYTPRTDRYFKDFNAVMRMAGEAMARYQAGKGPAKGPMKFHTAWHGSPHDHDGFSTKHIGTGEGAQAYGWGLYFAGKREVAEWYKDKLSNRSGYSTVVMMDGQDVTDKDIGWSIQALVKDALPLSDTNFVSGQDTYDYFVTALASKVAARLHNPDSIPDKMKAARDTVDRVRNYQKPYEDELPSFNKIADAVLDVVENRMEVKAPATGKLYEVELAPKEDEYLDYDRPLNQQSEKVKAALLKLDIDANEPQGTPKQLYENARRYFASATFPRDAREDIGIRQKLKVAHEAFQKGPDEYAETIRNLEDGYVKSRLMGKYRTEADKTGGAFYNDFAMEQFREAGAGFENRSKAASMALKEAGIPGIRYLDGSSRSLGTQVVDTSGKIADLQGERTSESFVNGFKTLDDAIAEAENQAKTWPNMQHVVDVLRSWQGKGYALQEPETHSNYVIFDDKDVSITAKFNQSDKPKQTDSAAFKAWFGDSKVVDKHGNPVVVYHGTAADFTEFDENELGGATEHASTALGFFFTEAPHIADKFNDAIGGNTMPVYLSITNPYVMTWAEFKRKFVDSALRDDRKARERAMELRDQIGWDGYYDGFKILAAVKKTGYEGDAVTWIPFKPEQIKSAVGNTGAFDPANADIRFNQIDAPEIRESRRGLLDSALRLSHGQLMADYLTKPTINWLIETGSKYLVPEIVKAGVVSNYGLPADYLEQKESMAIGQAKGAIEARDTAQLFWGLSREQARIAYLWKNEQDDAIAAELLARLPLKEQKELQIAEDRIEELSKEALALKLITPEAYERHKNAYIHRTYEKYEIDTPKTRGARARAIKMLGDQFKGRGMVDYVSDSSLKGRLGQDGTPIDIKGHTYVRLEHRKGKTQRLYGMVYWPTSQRVPEMYAGWKEAGTWEARYFNKSGKVGLWRDFTPNERQKMGEIDEIKYALAKTLNLMTHDIEVARFFKWVADEYAESSPEGLNVANTSEHLAVAYKHDEWVHVPITNIKGTSVPTYGALAGKYVPGPMWNDIRQLSNVKRGMDWYAPILNAWKISKTALSPATHMNNVMGNFVMAEMHDIGLRDLVKAVKVMAGDSPEAKAMKERYQVSGAELGSFMSREIKRDTLQSLLTQLQQEVDATGVSATVKMADILARTFHRDFKGAWAGIADTKLGRLTRKGGNLMMDAYAMEDSIFRMAAFLKAIDDGFTDQVAGRKAREDFLDYNINAPWINYLRGTLLPFVAFPYRAIPKLVTTLRDKPWKIEKLMLFFGGLNALAYAMMGLSGDDEDKERALLPDEKSGRLWGIIPKLMRMPWNDKHNSPVFLDVRRFIPVGDIVDFGQDHGAVPIPPMLMPGGPLWMMAELRLNDSGFTGREITKKTDDRTERVIKSLDYIYKGMMPNLVGVPGTYATTGVMNAAKGKTDVFGREQSVGQAALSSIGVKVGAYPRDVLLRNQKLDHDMKDRSLQQEQTGVMRQRQRNAISPEEMREQLEAIRKKRVDENKKLREKLSGKQ